MLWKLLTLLGLALAVYGLARRALGLSASGPPAPPVGGDVADLARCPDCGAWRAPETVCDCRTPPTP